MSQNVWATIMTFGPVTPNFYLPQFFFRSNLCLALISGTGMVFWIDLSLDGDFLNENCTLKKKIIRVFGDSLIIYLLFMPYYYILWDFRIIEMYGVKLWPVYIYFVQCMTTVYKSFISKLGMEIRKSTALIGEHLSIILFDNQLINYNLYYNQLINQNFYLFQLL
jgi:hypothetical protein